MTTRSVIGDAPKRREDLRFVTGCGRYLDDLAFDGLAHAVVLRSPHAHARIGHIATDEARAMPGVLAVLTAVDASADGLQPLRPTAEANVQTGEPFAFAPQPLLVDGKVRYTGEPVALIVAETRTQALDAAEQVIVDYAPLPAITTAAAARAPGAPQISAEVPGNVCFDWRAGDTAAAKAAFATAAHVVELPLDNHRIVTNPMEARGIIGFWDGMDTGVGAAVREAGKTGQVYVVTSGGGATSACDNVANGTFSALISYNAMGQGRDLNTLIKTLFEVKPKPGTMKVIDYSPLTVLTKDTLNPDSCWALPTTTASK